MTQLLEKYPEDLRLVYRHFPLVSIHDKALLSAQAAEAAGDQDKFWEMHDIIFEQQSQWSADAMSVDQFETWLIDQAGSLGLDTAQFQTDLKSAKNVAIAQEGWEKGQQIGLPGTPFLLINGYPYQGPIDFTNLDAIIQSVLLEKRQFDTCPPSVIDPRKEYVATLKTEKGDIQIQLLSDVAPIAVNSFVYLAQQNWFDNVTFHRVIPGFVAQTGDPTGTGFGGPGYAFKNETSPDLKFDSAGVVGMANSGADTNGSQFFITYGPTPNLDGGYTIFGKVIAGMDVVESLTPRDPAQSMGLQPGDKILDVVIEEK